MLAQNCIPARTKSTTELQRGTPELIRSFATECRESRQPEANQDRGSNVRGSRAQGDTSPRDAYACLEVAVSKYLESQAGSCCGCTRPALPVSSCGPLTARLPRQ
jgi:hypothetical protein